MDIVDEIRTDREAGALRLEQEFKPQLLAVASRFCTDQGEAEELVYRTMDEAVRCIDTFVVSNSLFAWMCGIMSNLHRKQNRRKINEKIAYTDQPPDMADESSGADKVVEEVDATLLREAIEGLPARLKEAVLLRYFADMPVLQIARSLTIPDGTVHSRLHMARIALAMRLGATLKKRPIVAMIAAAALFLAASAAVVVAVSTSESSTGRARSPSAPQSTGETPDATVPAAESFIGRAASPLAAAAENLSQNTISEEEEVKMNTSKLKRVFARTAAAIVAFASGNVSGLTWTGGAGDGLWNSPGNWSGNAVPTLGDNVVFENVSPITVTVSSSAANAKQVYVTGADVTITTSDSQSFVMRPSGANPDAENWNIVSVAKDATLTVSMQITGGQYPRMYLAKEGEGVFRIGGKVTQTERVDVKEGTLAYNASADGFAAETPSIIRSGAVFSVESAQFARNDQRFELEEGSVMDFNNKGDVLGYISGGGTVRNAGGLAFTLPSTTPSPFYGRLENCTSVTMRPGSWGNTYDGHHYVVSNANAFASCDVTVDGSVEEGKTPYEATNVLRFASGIGTFNFGKLSAVKGAKVNLADMEGAPVRVTATCSQANSANASFFGPGSLDMTVPSGETLAVTNDTLALKGDLFVTAAGGGGITLGTGSAEKDADFDVASLTALGANVVVKNTGDITWDFPVRMESSTLNYQGNGTLTLKDYRQRGNQLSVSSDSAQGLVLENARLDSGADGTQFVLSLPGAWEEPRLVFAGGSAYFKDYVAQGGVGYATSFRATDGADITFNSSSMLLSSGGKNRAIVLESGATAAFPTLDLVKDTTGLASGAVVTGRVTLAGGTLEISKNADRGTLKMTATGENAVGLVEFKGGTLRSNSRGYSSAWPANSRIVTTVGAEGGAIDIARTTPVTGNTTITINNPITSGVDSGTDGGLVKRGMGTVEFKAGNTFTGGLTIEEGRVIDAASSGTAVGTGIVTLDFGQLAVANAVTTRDYPGVSYCGAGAVMLKAAGQTATFASLERSGNGVLGLVHPNGQTLGSTLYVKSTADVPCHADGRVKVPIVGIDVGTSTGNHYSPASILKYDASSGFMPADVQEGFVGATSETAVKVTAADQTLSSNTSIGALVIDRDAGGNSLNINSGVTLHVGNGTDPALVLMNQYNNNGRRAYIAGQGTLDFGSSEGVVVVAANSTLGGISTKITGTGGLTITEPFNFETSGQCYHQLRLTGANTYTGGTRIYGVRVEAGSSSCFGCDYVEVGHGGQLAFESSSAAMTIANNLRVCGRGVPNTVGRDSLKGAVLSERPATLTGNVTLLGDITFAARALSTPASLTFSGVVGGTGDVTIAGNGTVAFTGANTFAGDVTVDSGATLKIGKANSLSKAKVALNGVLRVELDADGVITNTISGSGLIMLAGTHQARFTGLADFVGRIVTDPAATMELDGKDFEGKLTGEGTISNVGDETAEVCDTTAGEGVFGGSLAGDIRFVKAGAGMVTLTGTSTYNGGTVVADGTLRLGEARYAGLPVAEGLSMHLDASAEGSVETNAAGGVMAWHDLAEPTRILIQDFDDKRPSVRTSAMNGLPSVYFQGHHAEVSNTVAALTYQTFFAAVRPAGDGTDNSWGSAMLIGLSKKSSSTPDDLGIVCGGKGSWSVTGGALNERPPVWVNGQPGNTWSFGESHLFSFEKASAASFGTVGIGSGRTNLERSWYGDIGEIVVYSRALDPGEWFEVTRYLMKKWMPELYVDTYATTNVLPAAGTIDVAAGATLDLNGTYQSVGELTGYGAIVNTSTNEAVLAFDAGAIADFGGSISNVTLSVNGGTVGELGEMTVDSSCSINLEENAKLDLGGRTVTVTNASGYGRVVNGRLIVLGKDTRRRRGFCMNIR